MLLHGRPPIRACHSPMEWRVVATSNGNREILRIARLMWK
jgi:hypothetical protein